MNVLEGSSNITEKMSACSNCAQLPHLEYPYWSVTTLAPLQEGYFLKTWCSWNSFISEAKSPTNTENSGLQTAQLCSGKQAHSHPFKWLLTVQVPSLSTGACPRFGSLSSPHLSVFTRGSFITLDARAAHSFVRSGNSIFLRNLHLVCSCKYLERCRAAAFQHWAHTRLTCLTATPTWILHAFDARLINEGQRVWKGRQEG